MQIVRVVLALMLPWAAPASLLAQLPATEYEGSAALGVALRQLGTTKRVLMIAAHPDDERTEVLSTLALGQGAQVAYLALTRGEGGQNGIGPELQEALGLLRTEELMSARRVDGAQQFFTRAYDYGFSKSADEAFRHWPRDSLLADVVAVVRHFRPDVILAVFNGTPRDGHGQHQASGILAQEAFEAAADPRRFPEQVARGLRPHVTAKLYQSLWRGDEEEADQRMRTGEFDPLFGRSHYQIAAASRSRHRSQDMGTILEPGPRIGALRLVASRVGEGRYALFAGIDTTLVAAATGAATDGQGPAPDRQVPAVLADYERRIGEVRERFNPLQPESIVPGLSQALTLLRRAEQLQRSQGGAPELARELEVEIAELEQALALAAGLQVDAIASGETLVPGETVEVSASLWNGGSRPVTVAALAPRAGAGWGVEPLDPLPATLAPGALLTRRFRVTVPRDERPTEPYFLRQPRDGDLYRWPAEVSGVGHPFEPPLLEVRADVGLDEASLSVEQPVTYRGLDKMIGEFRRPLRVVPAVGVRLDPEVAIIPLGGSDRSRQFTVRLRSDATGGIAGTLRLQAPQGWRVEPQAVPVRFTAASEERTLEVRLHAPAGVRAGEFPLSAVFEAEDGRRFARGYQLVDYPHIQPRPLYDPASASVRALDVRVASNLRVGYIAGPGDEVPAALAQLGVQPVLLGPAELASGDLSGFDVIVTGIRAYEVRPDLLTHNQRLLEYVREGGTLVVQYNKYEFTEPGVAPYPVRMARPHDRVTDETAPVRILDPSHPILSTPNRIGAEDFEGWVQERGLYFLNDWDDRYTPLLEMADPGEQPMRGALVVAPLGQGTYVYTGLSLFRQLPEGVPGAYRLFANLLSLGAKN